VTVSPSSPLPGCRAVIFDLDGTLLDSAADLASAVDQTLAELGVPPAGEAMVQLWVGNGASKLLERALRHAGVDDEARIAQARARFFDHYGAHLAVRSQLYDGTLAALKQLSARGLRLAVCTNKPSRFVRPVLEAFGVAGYFAALLGGDDLPVKKPDPEPLLHLARELRLAPQACLMVGDSCHDVDAARAAGMPVVAVSYGYNHGEDIRNSHPDAVIDSLAQLPDLIA
jgi:phosphoglycolate phosphatase